MPHSQNHLLWRRKSLYALILLLLLSLICVAFSITGNNDFDLARREILLRRIGHELLLQSKDSTSRVLPIKKIAEDEYQISFENAITFQPDSLVSTTQRLFVQHPLASDYVVNVRNCGSNNVVYGYAISKNKKDDIIACKGRIQPKACYMINITFKPSGIVTTKIKYILGGVLFLGFAGFLFMRSMFRPRKTLPGYSGDIDRFTLGSVLFDAENRTLLLHDKTLDLTKTEARVLRIFALSPNMVIDRTRLQKEIWEDDGVIVGRSLDMFISKLRKKLELDPNIKIAVIRGKGYKLEINAVKNHFISS